MTKTTAVTTDRPYPARQGRLPRKLDAVTPEFLTSLLENLYPCVKVQKFVVVELKNSHTTKLRIDWHLNNAPDELPCQVCLKSNWSEGFESGEICELEARFYHLMRNEVSAPLPKVYYADWDGDGGGRGIVIMEDLGLTAGHFGNSQDHIGVDGVAAGLESLATLHGALWDSERLHEQRWLHRSMDTPVDTDQLLRMYNYLKLNTSKPKYKAILPQWIYDTPELFAQAFDELAAQEREYIGPLCLVHGDAHQGNSFLRENGERVWHDWQLVRKGTPWRDITYFMLGALTVEERRSSAKDLIRHYREALLATKAEGVLSEQQAWEQFRRWPVYGMQSWLANMDGWGQSGYGMVERFFTAAEDMETIQILTDGKQPRRQVVLGEGARPIAETLKE